MGCRPKPKTTCSPAHHTGSPQKHPPTASTRNFKDTMNHATDLVSLFALTPRKLKVRCVVKLQQLYQCYAMHATYKPSPTSSYFPLCSPCPTFPILNSIVFYKFYRLFQIPFGQSYMVGTARTCYLWRVRILFLLNMESPKFPAFRPEPNTDRGTKFTLAELQKQITKKNCLGYQVASWDTSPSHHVQVVGLARGCTGLGEPSHHVVQWPPLQTQIATPNFHLIRRHAEHRAWTSGRK